MRAGPPFLPPFEPMPRRYSRTGSGPSVMAR
jgi:hypothetical protein